MIKKYGEFLNETTTYGSQTDLLNFLKEMPATAATLLSVMEFNNEEIEKYVTVFYNAPEYTFIICEKVKQLDSKYFDYEKLREKYDFFTATSHLQAISHVHIMYMYKKNGLNNESFFTELVKIVDQYENVSKSFEDLKPLFIKAAKTYEEEYEETLDNEILAYIGMPPHGIASRKFGL
jgi:hypothetical protein